MIRGAAHGGIPDESRRLLLLLLLGMVAIGVITPKVNEHTRFSFVVS